MYFPENTKRHRTCARLNNMGIDQIDFPVGLHLVKIQEIAPEVNLMETLRTTDLYIILQVI